MNTTRPTSFFANRTVVFAALWIALVLQIVWTAAFLVRSQGPVSSLTRPLVFTAGFLALAITKGRVRRVAAIAGIIVGGAFLLALLHRFDNFPRFIAYTGVVNSFMPRAIIPALAVTATICECVLCIAMLLGIRLRWAAAGSAILLFMFAAAMTISGQSQFEWAVFVLAAGAWALANVDASLLSVDSILARSRANRGGN